MNLQGTVPGVSTRLGGPKAKKKAPVPSGGVACRPSLTFPPLTSSPALVCRPLSGRTTILEHLHSDPPLSVVGLPRLIAQVGPEMAIGDTMWVEGPRLMASALGTDIPVTAVDVLVEESTDQSLTDQDESTKITTFKDRKMKIGRDSKPCKVPLTGTEVVEIFAKKRHLGELEFYYLKAADADPYRPYDLREVHPSAAGSEHYIFSRNTVLHVTETGCGGLVTLAEWYRESVLWRALQDIPFFRDHRLRKSFAWWHRNVRKITFQRRCEKLQDMLLTAVPRFRQALFLFSSVIEELNEIHRLPQDELKTYTLLEFKNILIKKSQECLGMFEKFVQHRTVILNAVQEDSYREHQEMQLRVERSKKPNEHNHPLHLQLAHQQKLQKDLARAEHVLQKLGNMAALVNQMVVQGLVAFTQREVTSFLNNVMKREKIGQGCLFQTELIFSADGQLTVDPALHLFQEVVREALLTVVDSAIQMSDTCCLFLETGDIGTSGTFLSGSAQGLTPVLSLAGYSPLPAITVPGDYQYDDNGMTGLRGLFCRRETTDQSAHVLVLPKLKPFAVQGHGLRGCYYPLSKRQLEWQLRINDVSKEVEREQARIMQETQSQIQQLCDGYAWLVDVHLFTSQWRVASPEAVKAQPAFVYEEHIEKVRHWTEKIHTVSPSFTTSNQLFIIHCAHILEKLGLQLKSIEEDVLTQLVEQTKLHSESLISNLKRAIAELEKEPIDFYEFAEYATMVKRCEKTSADMQQHLEYVRSLQDTICTNYRNMSEREVTLKEQMQSLWDSYVPLVKQAEKTVCQRLPSMSVGLDQIFSYLVRDLDRTVSGATSGLFLDPAQNADEMFSMLNVLCRQAYASNEKLKELSLTSANLRGHPLDLTVVTTSVQKIEARKELWELMSVCTAKIQEWSHLPFIKFTVSQAQEKVGAWQQQAVSLTRTIPTHDAVLQKTLKTLEHFSHHLPVLAKLCNPILKHKHLRNIFKDTGLLYVPEMKLTVAELMSKQLEEHVKIIDKVYREAKAEWDMEQAFWKLRQAWEDRVFLMGKLTVSVRQRDEPQRRSPCAQRPPTDAVLKNQTAGQHSCDGATLIVAGLEGLLAETEDSVMTLSNMLISPHIAEFKLEVEHLVQLLQELEEVLDFLDRYQQTWAFLTKMFHETTVSAQRVELLEKFAPVDKTFKEIIHSISSDPRALNIVCSEKTNDQFHGNRLCTVLVNGLSVMEAISKQMLCLLDAPRAQFPRLCFLSDKEVIKLLSLHPTPSALLPVVRKCFKGVRWLEVDRQIPSDGTDLNSCLDTSDPHIQVKVLGIFGSFGEHVAFLCPVEPNLDPLVWLCTLEKQLLRTMTRLMKQCAVARKELELVDRDLERSETCNQDVQPVLDLLSDYPLQCLLVVEEAAWCSELLKVSQVSVPEKWSCMKKRTSSKLKNLCRAIRELITSASDRSVVSDRAMMFLRALVQFTVNHTQQLSRLTDVKCELRSSFEWQSLMKFRITSDLQNPNDLDCRLESSNRSTCYVDVLGSRLLYGYEYLGPEHWTMVNTPSTDRAVLGLLLALTGYRCGFVSGPCMSGKTKTVVQLGRALGRQVIAFQCYLSMSPSVIQQMLLGALQTGAWLVLDSADLMTQGVLSLLGQHLVDIRQAFSAEQRVDWEPKDRISDAEKGYENLVEPDCPISFAGKSIFAKLSYGCIIISSKGYTTEIPESLRAATRPIALTHPDYRIIAEVMLASSGFSEAMFLSQRLVSLFSLAKDSLFLPDFINKDHISWVVVLQNVIAASVIHLKQSICQRQVSHEGEASAEERKARKSSHDLTDQVSERDGEHKDTRLFGFKHISQCAAVVQGVMEEKAVVKALFSVFLPAIHEAKKASQFQTFLGETFPMARSFPFAQHYIEGKEQNLLKDAVAEEVQRTGLHSDAQIIRNALTLYQALKFSPAVLLIGPSGSGKTTCYRTLAGALRSLAARAAEDVSDEDNATDGDAPPTEPRIPVSNWSSVDTVVLFPNAMSHEELFGGRTGKGRWDGAVAKALRESERHDLSADAISNGKRKRDQIRKVKWLVMDGEPLGRPGWLDCFGTLCSPEDPALRLSSGEKIAPSHSGLKLLAEITDLSDANPSTVTRCAVTYFTGTDLWKAVWKVEMDALNRERSLDQETLNMWNRLAEDLFGCTLKLLRQNALTSAVHTSQFCESAAYGLQEITSFIRILHAFLEAFGTGPWSKATPSEIDKNDTLLHGAQTRGTEAQIDSTLQEQQAKNIFLVAYIWGFGGHLHPHHWPQFDLLARQALFNSRYRVEVPRHGTVFEHFFSQSEGTVGDIINSLNCPRSKQAQLADPIVPKYEKYAYLLDLMLEAKQPVLLVGEAASGKTSLCKTLLSQGRPHISLPAGQLLSSPHVRNALHKGFRKACPSTTGATTGLLLFVDDLHEAPHDAFGKVSKALETLRQSILKGGTLTSDGCHFKLFNSGAISYMATCRTSGSGDHSRDAISPRLSRLFSIFVLPGMSVEVLFSIHSPRLKLWLKDFPCTPGSGDMARGIVAATEDLYRAVRERFQSAVQRSYVIFTQHDLQKVFQGMYLCQPCNLNRQPLQKNVSPVTVLARSGQMGYSPAALGPAAAVLNIAHLWMHECLRVFSDRLCSEDESKTLASLIAKVSEAYFGSRLVDDSQPVGSVETPTATIPTLTSTLPKETETTNIKLTNQTRGASLTQLATKPLVSLGTLREEKHSRLSDRPSGSDSGSLDSNVFSDNSTTDGSLEDISTPNESKSSVKEEQKVVKTDKLAQQDVSSCKVLTPSPPKGLKPFHQSDWKRVRKLTELSLQMQSDDSEEPRPDAPPLPLQLLQHMEESMDQIVYGPDLSEPVHSNFKRSSSYQERDFDLLLQRLPATTKRKAEDEEEERDDNYSIMSGYAIHRQRVHQLLHVVRALLVPGGHGVLFGSVGGTGRKTTVRLAACLMDCQLMEVHPGNEGKLREILKEAGRQAGTDSANVVILAHEEISLAVREELLVVMAHGVCPALYSDEELASFFPRMDAVKNLGRCSMHNHTLERYLKYFQRNVHVFLLMPFTASHSSNVPGWNEHVTKALSLSCCVEVYQPWSRQSLEEAAAHRLKASPHIPDSDGKVAITSLAASLSLVMARIHQSACRYASVHLITQPFSPQTYMNFIAHYFYLCSHLREQGLGQANGVATVLAHLNVLTNTALQYKQDTLRLQEKVAETQQCEKELLRAVDIERRLFKEARQSCVVEETNLFHLEEQIQQTQQQINRYFEEVSPLFLTGIETVKCLSASDLEEVRHYRNPPEGVVKIMDSLCLLFDRPRSWESAKQLLGQSDFFQELEFFDRYKLTNNKLQQLAQIVDSPHFLPESVREVSQACESLCCWVRSVYQCARTKHRMSALDASKRRWGDLAAEARGRLRVARLQEEEVGQRLEDTERQLQLVGKDLDELLLRLSEAEKTEKQAAAAVALLESHIADWTAAAQEAKLNNRNIPGDAVVLAAVISYLGPFGPDVRTELLSKWKELCLTGNINVDPEDPRTSLFTDADPTPPDPRVGFSVPVAEKLESALARAVGMDQWRVRGLQPRLLVKLLLWAYRGPWAQRWPLLANAQHHEEISSGSTLVTGENTRVEMEAEYGMVVCADHPELLDKLGQAAEKGLRVLVTHVERAVPSPEFLAMLVRPGGSCLPGLRRPLQPAHPEFCLFLSTRLPVRLLESEIHPSILADVGVVDLSLSSAEIQEVMLTQLLPSLCTEPLIQHSLVQNDKQAMQYKLVKEQVSLMDYIQQSFTPLLQDSDFLPRVISCREASQKLQAEIQHLSAKLERYDSLLAGPQGAARLAAAFYQALQEVARLSPAYFFSLRGFIATMRGAVVLKGMPGVSDTGSQVTEGVVSEIVHRMVAHLLAQYRPCLFQDHATLLRLLVSVALLQHRQLCSEAERAAFLRGLGDVDLPPHKAKPFSNTSAAPADVAYRPALPGWIPSDVHPELLRLERTPGFRGLVASLATYPRLWQEYLRLASSTVVGAVPCQSHSHLSLLQRALLWKTVLPHRLAVVAEDVAACQLGLPRQTSVGEDPHTGNPEALSLFLIKHEGPVILTLPDPARERWASVDPLHLLNQLTSYQADTKEVQVKVISFGVRCEREVTLSGLDEAAHEGHWLVFNNCHLLEQWDDKVMFRINQLTSPPKDVKVSEGLFTGGPSPSFLVHPRFRLWFITRGCNPHCIPAAVRMCALHLVCDSPRDVKEELSCSLRQVVSDARSESPSGVAAGGAETLVRCAVLHSVLLQRQAYKYLGQGNVYHWTQEDLLTLVEAYARVASLCHDRTEALQYIAVNLVYGGHVSDSTDLEVVKSVAKACLSAASPLWGSGPHVLANIVCIPGYFDTSGLLQALEHRIQGLANISDPSVLGFSADLAAEIVKINSHTLNIMLRDSQTPLRKVRSSGNEPNKPATLPGYVQARDRLRALKSNLAFKDDGAAQSEGPVPRSPLRDFLQAEWDGLRDLVSSLLSQLRQPVQHGTPAVSSLLQVANLSRLERRAELLRAYLWDDTAGDPSTAFRLSAFKNARGFLVAVMREAAQAQRKDVSDVALEFQVLSVLTSRASLPPGSVYLYGLELRGALWDTRLGALQDTLSPRPCLLPLLNVRARSRRTDTCRTSHVKNTDTVQSSDGPQANATRLPVYQCPLYLDGERESGDTNIVTRVPLLAKLNPVLCSLRRVRLVSTL